MVWKVSWKVYVDGQDMTDAMRPFLISISATDKDGAESDTCELVFDDSEGQLRLPREGAKAKVMLEGQQIFAGTVDTVRSSGARGEGRLLRVGCKGMDARGKVKEPQLFHKDDASLEDFLGQAAEQAGLAGIRVSPRLAGRMRDYWSAESESFIHLGRRLAREFNATFKIRAGEGGDVAVLWGRDEDAGLPTVKGTVGINVISWDIAPFTGRDVFTRGRVSWFDREEARYRSREVQFEIDRDLPEATNLVRSIAADEDHAEGIAEGRKGEAKREAGEGSVKLDLTLGAQAEAPFELSGARPGVDGTYRISSVTHRADRGGGSTTDIEIKQPEKGAGKDDRRPTEGPGAPGDPRPQPGPAAGTTGQGNTGPIDTGGVFDQL